MIIPTPIPKSELFGMNLVDSESKLELNSIRDGIRIERSGGVGI